MRNVVYACDDKYIEQTMVSMVSLFKHNSYPIKIWIVSDNISANNEKLIWEQVSAYGGKLEFLDIEEVLKGIPIETGSRHPRTVYAKLFLDDFIDAERVLYLDSDTVINGDLTPLWERNIEQELVAGVQMPYSSKLKAQMHIDANAPYLCDGIVILNLSLWRERQIGTQCQAYIAACNGMPQMLSEETLNYVCQGYVGVLEPKYNLMPFMMMYSRAQICKLFNVPSYYAEESLEVAKKYPVIIHFINELFNRPWLEPGDHPYKDLYRLERQCIFGDLPYERRRLNPNTRLTRLLKAILPFQVFAILYHMKHKDI